MQFIECVLCCFLLLFYVFKVELKVTPIQLQSDCGCRINWNQTTTFQNMNVRSAKIIAGFPVKEGQFPWQASLELLHPSLGFLGHWCGGVLIHEYWVLSAAHCVHNDLFNLPIPPLWTIVLGEHNRLIESGNEQRIPVEKIILHKRYENFHHDLVLMKLSRPANLSRKSTVRKICLPLMFNEEMSVEDMENLQKDSLEDVSDPDFDPLDSNPFEFPEKMDNFLRSFQSRTAAHHIPFPSMRELMNLKILNRLKQSLSHNQHKNFALNFPRRGRRRNDKLMKIAPYPNDSKELEKSILQKNRRENTNYNDLPYIDCVATGWGKANITGDLTDVLLKISVPLHNNKREAYGSFVKIHKGHLCAGKLNGKGGTCVGDSGGPLQCRLSESGPWILAGITSFGSGCAIEGYPDVYTRTSFYIKWIQNTISYS